MPNVIKSAYRNFTRRPVTNLINLLGLAISLALVIILSVYSYSELTTDNFQKNRDRLYLYENLKNHLYTLAVLKDQIDLAVAEIEAIARIGGTRETPVFHVKDKKTISSDIIFSNKDFFKLFTYQAIDGDLASSLKEPMTMKYE
jgi:putative ABC transport system permease protein